MGSAWLLAEVVAAAEPHSGRHEGDKVATGPRRRVHHRAPSSPLGHGLPRAAQRQPAGPEPPRGRAARAGAGAKLGLGSSSGWPRSARLPSRRHSLTWMACRTIVRGV
jgi:hypothetical protein